MANVMSLTNVRNRVSYNGFDLSEKINFTAKVGEMLPVWWHPVLAPDKLRINLKSFCRTMPFNAAAFARMRGYFDFYFVPFNQLWNKSDTVITQMLENSQSSTSFDGSSWRALSGEFPHIDYYSVMEYINRIYRLKDENMFGFDRAMASCKLLEYLRLGDYWSACTDAEFSPGSDVDQTYVDNPQFNLFPLLAYQKIYADYFRYSQWERSAPNTFNVDFIKGTDDLASLASVISAPQFYSFLNLFDLRYCNYEKDMLHGLLPVAQYGDAAVVPISASGLDIVPDDTKMPTFAFRGSDGKIDSTTYPDGQPIVGFGGSSFPLSSDHGSDTADNHNLIWKDPALKSVLSDYQASVSVLAIRRAEAAQKWKEISNANEQDYPSQIKAHWDENVSNYMSNMSMYLGGITMNLDINEVVNTTFTEDSGAADLKGKGYMSSDGYVNFDSPGKYGIIMCIFHALPLLDYITSGIHPFALTVNSADIPIPEFDRIGMESADRLWFLNPSLENGGSVIQDTKLFGYGPRYMPYKTAMDHSLGEFKRTLSQWILPYTDDDIIHALDISGSQVPPSTSDSPSGVTQGFFKVNPHVVDNLFVVRAGDGTNSDVLLCSNFFDVKVVRKLDVNGLPY